MIAILRAFGPHLAVIAALAAIIWWIDDKAADRTRREMRAAAAEAAAGLHVQMRQSEQRVAAAINGIDLTVAAQVRAIEATRTIIQPTITREIFLDPRLSDPDAGISGGLLDALNSARASFTCSPRPDGGIECALPPAADDR